MTPEGAVLIIAAVGLAATQIITAIRTGNTVKSADKKLDVVVAQGDGMRTELLDRITTLERLLAVRSGDQTRADNAQQAADDHRAAIVTAKDPR